MSDQGNNTFRNLFFTILAGIVVAVVGLWLECMP